MAPEAGNGPTTTTTNTRSGPPSPSPSPAAETMMAAAKAKKRPAPAADLEAPPKVAKRRAARACVSCRARKVRCDVVESSPCGNCRWDNVEVSLFFGTFFLREAVSSSFTPAVPSLSGRHPQPSSSVISAAHKRALAAVTAPLLTPSTASASCKKAGVESESKQGRHGRPFFLFFFFFFFNLRLRPPLGLLPPSPHVQSGEVSSASVGVKRRSL